MLTPDPQAVQEALRASHETLHGTPEQNRRERERQLKVLTDRHAQLLEAAHEPTLHGLIEAHGPQPDGSWAVCAECPEVPNHYGDADPESWRFISDRMEVPGADT